MRYRNRKFQNCPAMTLLEIVISLAIITIIFAAVLPQFRVISNGWDSRQANTEVIQNGRVLIDHLNRNLSKAVKITAVSDSAETDGFIEFQDNDGNNFRYDVNSTSNYVEFGLVGDLSDLAGPVSSLTFTCYDACDLDAPLDISTADVNDIRFVNVQTTLPNPAALGQDKTFTVSAYLRTNDESSECDLVGWWKLDETSGTNASDSSGNGNDGTLVNMDPATDWVTGQINGALDFDGTNDYVDLGTDSSLNFGNSEPFTVAAWVKTTENYGMIVSFRSSTDDGPVIDLAVGYEGGANDPGKAMILVRQDGGSSGYANVKGGSVNDGQWNHMAAVRGSDGTIELFLDGVSQGTASGAQSGGAITTNLRAIGSERRWVNDGFGTADQRYLAGTIDDVRIYNRALSPEEVAQLVNKVKYREFTEAKVGSDNTSVTISTPDTNEGDLLIAAVATDGDTSLSLSPPGGEGWTEVDLDDYSGAVTLGAWWKLAEASEPASHEFSWSGGQQAYGWMMHFTGHNSAEPINDYATYGQSSSTPTSPAVTTTVKNCLILRLGAFDDDDVNNLPEPGNPGLSGHTAITMETSGSSGPVGWWKFDETSGLTAADSSGFGNNGTLINMAGNEWTTGRINGALVFDGTNDYVNLGTGSSLNFGSSKPFTVAAWVKTTENYGMIISFRSSTDGGPVIDLAVGYEGGANDPGKVMILVRQDGGSSYAHVKGGSVKDGQWHHVVGVRGSGSTIELFLDGVSQGTASGAQSGGAITTNLRAIGSERRWVNDGYGTSDQRYLAGTIDDVRVYNRSLSTGEIAALYSGNEIGGSGDPVSGGAGYIKQSTAGLSSGTPTFSLTASNEARMLTIAIAPAESGGCDGSILP